MEDKEVGGGGWGRLESKDEGLVSRYVYVWFPCTHK